MSVTSWNYLGSPKTRESPVYMTRGYLLPEIGAMLHLLYLRGAYSLYSRTHCPSLQLNAQDGLEALRDWRWNSLLCYDDEKMYFVSRTITIRRRSLRKMFKTFFSMIMRCSEVEFPSINHLEWITVLGFGGVFFLPLLRVGHRLLSHPLGVPEMTAIPMGLKAHWIRDG